MADLLDIINLRNVYRIYAEGEDYRVVQQDKHGDEHSRTIPSNVVDYVQKEFMGSRISAEEASLALEKVGDEFNLPYTYGYKLQYYAQSVLLVLIARGDASLEKKGRGHLYTIH